MWAICVLGPGMVNQFETNFSCRAFLLFVLFRISVSLLLGWWIVSWYVLLKKPFPSIFLLPSQKTKGFFKAVKLPFSVRATEKSETVCQ
jgi:hypothetical protein